jgi:hypothetical protein
VQAATSNGDQKAAQAEALTAHKWTSAFKLPRFANKYKTTAARAAVTAFGCHDIQYRHWLMTAFAKSWRRQ